LIAKYFKGKGHKTPCEAQKTIFQSK